MLTEETEQFARQEARRLAAELFPGRKVTPEGFEPAVAVALTRAYQMGIETGATDLKATHRLVTEAVERLQYTFRHLLGVKDLGSEGLTSIVDLYRSGMKIEAIKLYRHRMGVGLKEAKDAIEELEQHRQ